jgi:hypothetical protein
MRKLFGLVAILAITLTLPVTSKAQMWSGSGNKVQFTYPFGLTGQNYYTFPSFDLDTLETADTINVGAYALETYATIDTVKRHTNPTNVLIITPGAGQQPGCKFYLQAGEIDSIRQVYVVQNVNSTYTTVDTFTVKSSSDQRTYLWNGTRYKKIIY